MTSSSPLISCSHISKSYGAKPLFDDLSLTIFEKDAIGLVGANGTGKTTLLKILSGKEHQDSGQIIARKGLRMHYVAQHPQTSQHTVWKEVHDLCLQNITHLDKNPETWTAIVLSLFGFPEEERDPYTSRRVSDLSGGWQKRLDIAKAYAARPDLFLLDEPTNHLDMESIQWLEQFIRKNLSQYVIVSHDRSFLDAVSDAIIELNPRFFDGHIKIKGSYSEYVVEREAYIEAMRRRSQGLASQVRSEAEWLLRRPKARTTKGQARVDAALAKKEELLDLQQRLTTRTLSLKFHERECETRKLITLKNVSYTQPLATMPLISHLDLTISPRMRLGIVGPNGSGKTTFLKIIAQELAPTQGTIKYAPGLKIVYFDQARKQLPDAWTLGHALGRGREYVQFGDQQIHLHGWAKKFLFDPERLSLPISQLSGGERARVYIAHLITEPADVLLLDEPTNDLDIDTLQVLEECLLEFHGAVLLVCHDRTFLQNATTSLLALGMAVKEGDHHIYPDIEQWQKACRTVTAPLEEKKSAPKKLTKKPALSYKEEKELAWITEEIERREQEIARDNCTLEETLSSTPQADVSSICRNISAHEENIVKLWSRWEELEGKKYL